MGAIGLCATALAGCGGGERQDKNEPRGEFRLEVTDAQFPSGQKLAKRSQLKINVRNSGDETVPNVAVTVSGFDERLEDRGLADPERPVFVINGQPKDIGGFPESKDAAPEGGETAFVDTWALGRLRAGEQKTFKWSVTAVRAGDYKLEYEVAAGLDGKARAVGVGGEAPRGTFAGTISDEAPATRIGDDGRSIIRGTR